MARKFSLGQDIGRALVGAGLAFARRPAWRLRDLASFENPLLGCVARDEAAQPVVVNVGQVLPGDLIEVIGIRREDGGRDALDAAGDEQGRRDAGLGQRLDDLGGAAGPDGKEQKVGGLLPQVLDGGRDLHGIGIAVGKGEPMIGHQRHSARGAHEAVGQRVAKEAVLDADKGRALGADLFDELHQHRNALVVLRGARREDVGVVGKDRGDGDVRKQGDAARLNFRPRRIEHRLGPLRVAQPDEGQRIGIGDGIVHLGDGALVVALIVEKLQLDPAPGDSALRVQLVALLGRERLDRGKIAAVVATVGAGADEELDLERGLSGLGLGGRRRRDAETQETYRHDRQAEEPTRRNGSAQLPCEQWQSGAGRCFSSARSRLGHG